MKQLWDIAIQDKDHQLVLIVELKINRHTKIKSRDWASKSYYNLRSNGIIPPAPYFLFAFLDYLYLWDNNNLQIDEDNQMIIPNYSGDAKVILNPYFKKINIKPETINEYGFGIIVSSWLRDIISENININEIGEYQDILINSGLYDSIVEGNLNYEVAA